MRYEEYKTVKDTGAVKTYSIAFSKAIVKSFLFTAIVFALAALLLTYTPLSESLISPIVILTSVISVIIAGASAARSIRHRGLLTGALTGILYSIILYLFSSLAGESIAVSPYILIMTAVSLFAGSVGGILGINLSGKRKR
jgi:putative membrane protein (TIGR04086 family)